MTTIALIFTACLANTDLENCRGFAIVYPGDSLEECNMNGAVAKLEWIEENPSYVTADGYKCARIVAANNRKGITK